MARELTGRLPEGDPSRQRGPTRPADPADSEGGYANSSCGGARALHALHRRIGCGGRWNAARRSHRGRCMARGTVRDASVSRRCFGVVLQFILTRVLIFTALRRRILKSYAARHSAGLARDSAIMIAESVREHPTELLMTDFLDWRAVVPDPPPPY